jgi:hypothetical protein
MGVLTSTFRRQFFDKKRRPFVGFEPPVIIGKAPESISFGQKKPQLHVAANSHSDVNP